MSSGRQFPTKMFGRITQGKQTALRSTPAEEPGKKKRKTWALAQGQRREWDLAKVEHLSHKYDKLISKFLINLLFTFDPFLFLVWI